MRCLPLVREGVLHFRVMRCGRGLCTTHYIVHSRLICSCRQRYCKKSSAQALWRKNFRRIFGSQGCRCWARLPANGNANLPARSKSNVLSSPETFAQYSESVNLANHLTIYSCDFIIALFKMLSIA